MELKRYRKARNELAHMNLLSNEELCVILKAEKAENAKKSGFKKKNGLQIITRERVRFNIWEMLMI